MCAVFKLKYPTTCAECGKQLEVGEEVKGRVTRREDGSKKWFITCKEHIPQLPQIELVQIDTTPTHVTIYCDGACEPTIQVVQQHGDLLLMSHPPSNPSIMPSGL